MRVKFNPTGTHVHKDFLKVRLDFDPDITDKTYQLHHVYMPVYPKEGYTGKVDEFGTPIDQKAYDTWVESLPHIWQLNPCLCAFFTIDEMLSKDDLMGFMEQRLTPDVVKTIDDVLVLPDSAHYISPLMRDRSKLTNKVVLTRDYEDLIQSVNLRFKDLTPQLDRLDTGLDIQPQTIDIGAAAIDRGSDLAGSYTMVAAENPANASGTIDTVEVWLNAQCTSFDVAMFEQVSANTFTTRDTENEGTVAAGSKQTLITDLTVVTGDFIGWYGNGTGSIERDLVGTGYWVEVADYIPCTNQVITFYATRTISLYGTGTEAGGAALEKSLSDSVSISDSISKGVGKVRSDSFSLSDLISKANSLNKGDSFSISDTLSKSLGLIKTDSLSISDSLSKGIGLFKTETLNIADSFLRTVTYVRAFADNLSIADSIGKSIGKIRADTLAITDSMIASLGGILSIVLQDTVVITDSLVGIICESKSLKRIVSRMNVARMSVSRMPLIRTICRRFTA